MQPTAEDIESTLRTAQQLREQSKLLLEQLERRNVDAEKLSADYQAALKRMYEVINSPKATEKIAEQCLAAFEEMCADLRKAESIFDEALASARANEGPPTKPSRHRGTRV
jgi:hypothetical protein